MRTVIDIDKELLETAQKKLGAPTMKETVHAALQAVVDRDAERASAIEAFEFWRTEGSPDLLDPEIMKHAWQQQD
ncbi:type II toxin-antitoxin system VapB family antitoxin [Nonomuraea basaltis]|uniref:type II toxin-antitoxin system VapB family antitoxin n=1 Tax=Nonomuraea basaltis TaxID=2495887 RepID=UPI00110C4C4C|nr:type II toxin-antitoxin system VapB family antitoxin [Nonomuraea basaltis]TMR98090.1 type II toxin-antitoxin system VapB family antitoxin [Nonomuraea basaltis]